MTRIESRTKTRKIENWNSQYVPELVQCSATMFSLFFGVHMKQLHCTQFEMFFPNARSVIMSVPTKMESFCFFSCCCLFTCLYFWKCYCECYYHDIVLPLCRLTIRKIYKIQIYNMLKNNVEKNEQKYKIVLFRFIIFFILVA